MAHYLICYDIADPKRLAKVHRCIIRHALFIQLSVYYLQGSRRELDNVLAELQDLIDDRRDDVRAYLVTSLADSLQIGCPWLPEGLCLHE